jgi:site-specific DNA recombinase
VKCGECGGNYTVIDRNRWGCSRHREAGTCGNGRRIAGAELDARVLAGFKEKLLAPDVVAHACRQYHLQQLQQTAEQSRARRLAEARLQEAEAAIARLVDAIADGSAVAAQLKAKLAEKEAQRAAAAAELEEEAASAVIMLHPQLAEAYRRRIEELELTLNKGEVTDDSSAGKIRAMIDSVTVTPQGDGSNDITVLVSLAAAIALGQDGPSLRRSASQRGALMVAEDRYRQSPSLGLRSFKA